MDGRDWVLPGQVVADDCLWAIWSGGEKAIFGNRRKIITSPASFLYFIFWKGVLDFIVHLFICFISRPWFQPSRKYFYNPFIILCKYLLEKIQNIRKGCMSYAGRIPVCIKILIKPFLYYLFVKLFHDSTGLGERVLESLLKLKIWPLSILEIHWLVI